MEQKEIEQKKKRNTKRIIALTIFSMLLSLTFIGVAVFAALTQSVSISNTVTISTDGQAKTTVDIYEGSATSIADAPAFTTTTPVTELTFLDTASVTKGINEDTKTGTVTPILFSASEGKNWYGYKVVLTNTNASAINYTINLYNQGTTDAYANDEQVVITSAKGTSALATYAPITGSLAKSGSETVYIVFSTTEGLGNLATASQTQFDMNINISVQ